MNQQQLEERQDEVLRLLRARDQRGVSLLFYHYGGALMAIITPIVPQRELADELLHDVLLKIWDKIDTYDADKSRLFTWMARLTRNAAIDLVRSKAYREQYKTDELSDSVAKRKELSTTTNTDQIGVHGLLKHLDADLSRLIKLLYLQEYTQSEAAKKLGIPLGTVKTRARRAMLQLRELLKHEMAWVPLLYFFLELFGL